MEDIAWAAGFFDAEGTVHYNATAKYVVITISQAERAPLDRFAAIIGAGNVRGPYKQTSGHNKRPLWSYRLYATGAVEDALQRLIPWLSETKTEQARRSFGSLDGSRGRLVGYPSLGEEASFRSMLAWAAGFMDGDGCFSYSRSNRCPVVSIPQVDRRPLQRFLNTVGIGKIYGPYDPHPTSDGISPFYNYRAHGIVRVQAIAAMLWPWLGATKRAQATRVLEQARRHSRATRCARGHVKTPSQHGCPECHRDFWHRRRTGIGPQGTLFERPPPYAVTTGVPEPAAMALWSQRFVPAGV